MAETRLLTIKDFCACYGAGRTKVYKLLKAGALEGVKSGPRTLIRADSAERWASSLPRFPQKSRTGPDGFRKLSAPISDL